MKGTAAHGRKSGKKSHIICRRCGKHAMHKRTGIYASCGFGSAARMRPIENARKISA